VLQSEIFRQAQRVSIYLSTTSELDTTALLLEMFRLEKMVFVPTYEGTKMKMVRLRGMDEYESAGKSQIILYYSINTHLKLIFM